MAANRQYKLLYADVSRAYFYAAAARQVYVQLPDEDRGPDDIGKCGKLRASMYGTRDAAMNWATEYGETLKKAGFVQGKSSPCLFFNRSLDVTIMVHGDDFVAIGNPKHLQATEDALRSKYKIKTETLGGCAGDKKEVKILNKIVRYTDDGLELEADPRHAELIVREFGLEGCRPSKTPGSKAVAEKQRVIKPSREAPASEGELAAIETEGELVDDDIGQDSWSCSGDGGVWRRVHKSRRALFTPSGVQGSPSRPGSSLKKVRITEETFDDDGEPFMIVDDWTDRKIAHRRLERMWSGTTSFECTHPTSVVGQSDGSVGNQCSGTDEAAGPTAVQDEDAEGMWAAPKPNQPAGLLVRRSGGEILHMKAATDIDIDGIENSGNAWEEFIDDGDRDNDDETELLGTEATSYRAVTARLNYIGPDRIDVQYATKE